MAGLSLPVTRPQAEEGSATATASDGEEEQRRKAEAKERIEAGGAAAGFGFSTLSGCLSFPSDAKHAKNVPFIICLFLAFVTFVSGTALMLFSINMLGLRADLVSGGRQYVAAKCLAFSCAAFSVLTLFSLVELLPSRLYKYKYIILAAANMLVLLAAGVHCYPRRRTGGDDEAAAAYNDEHKEELEAASKNASGIINCAIGGLLGVVFSGSKISVAAADAVDKAAYVAIFFMFATAVLGMFVMTVWKKVPGITKPRFRRLFITAIRLVNASMLCSLACAAFAASFVVLRYRVFAAFAPLAISGTVCFLPRRCVVRRGGGAGEANNQRENHLEQLKAIEDLASKVTTTTFGTIMSVLGASLGKKDSSKQAGGRDMLMIVLTSAFFSGFGFMLLAAAPGSARAHLAPAAKVLVWSSVALFAATAAAAYGVEVEIFHGLD